MTASRSIFIAAGILGFAGVGLGAIGAHALRETLEARATLATWQTGALYHMLHALALLGLGAAADRLPGANAIARCWIAGIALFSGSLYAYALGGPHWMVFLTPLGGLALLAGWAWLVVDAIRGAHAGD